jgi:nitroimidazol reductase NimA-like FMN-containing flavoprotein (pyridoxamine 5'-phosphate oxidase superfamily)
MADRTIEELDEEQCLALIAPGGVGRIAYTSRFGPVVLPVNYALQDGAIVFRTAEHGPLDEDLRTGITGADYTVAFEIDNIDLVGRKGWSVLIQGPAHHMTGPGQDAVRSAARASSPGRRATGSCSSGSRRTASPAAASAPPEDR